VVPLGAVPHVDTLVAAPRPEGKAFGAQGLAFSVKVRGSGLGSRVWGLRLGYRVWSSTYSRPAGTGFGSAGSEVRV